MKKLPIGIQTLSKIIEGNFVYVDKTEIAHRLIDRGGYYFLSRPRRFGKSLFLDTLKEIFEGNKELFKGLYIYDNWDWEVKSPVLKISMGSGVLKNIEKLNKRLNSTLEDAAKSVGINCQSSDPGECFKELIQKASEKHNQKVVILIDEYDKPILDNITDKEIAREMRDAMKDFYGVIKDNDTYIRLVFITGVSKFSKMNLFSGLNNLEDITLNADFGDICGYTHDDLLTVFEEHLRGADMKMVQEWYNGYNYFGKKVYNPFDILLFISNHFKFRNYWWSTGNPSFLIEMLKTGDYYIPDLENYEATDEILDSFDVDRIELVALLWQTGYLTIKKESQTVFGMEYQLKAPNKEVQTSLNSMLITYLTTETARKLSKQRNLLKVLENGDMDGLKNMLTTLFASIPYNNFTNNRLLEYEGYYASVVYAYIASLGMEIIPEDTTNFGKMDLTVKMPDGKIYIIEFRLTEKATGEALRQIKEKRYFEKYQTDNDFYLVGIEFSRAERNVIGFEWEQMV